MAKRRRLGPALVSEGDSETPFLARPSIFPEALESAQPITQMRVRPPIADVAHETARAAAAEDMADALATARSEGRLILTLPLDAVDEHYLVRDRLAVDQEEMSALQVSIAARGQQMPIEVEALGDGRWGLISGWRRLSALRALSEKGQGAGTVLAIVRKPEDKPAAYQAMVEENEIRVGLSFYERGRIVARAVAAEVFADDRTALQTLFASASRAKRSKVGSFVRIVRALDGSLKFPTALSERTGLALAQALETKGFAEKAARALDESKVTNGEEEAALIAKLIASLDEKAPKVKKAEVWALSLPGLKAKSTGGKITLSGDRAESSDFLEKLEAFLKGI